LRLFEVDEDLQLVLQDARSVSNGVFRRDRAIGLDVEDQLVIVQNLTFTGVLHLVGHALDRRIEAVDRDQADRRIFWAVAIGRFHIALAGVDGELHADFSAFIKRADLHVIRVQDGSMSPVLDIASGHDARTLLAQIMRLGPSPSMRNAISLMFSTMSVTSSRTPGMDENSCSTPSICTRSRRALQRRQQDTAQRVAQRQAIATLKRLSNNLSNPTVFAGPASLQLLGLIRFCQFFRGSRVTPLGLAHLSAGLGAVDTPEKAWNMDLPPVCPSR
jgi:hypothetical protein